ncbi:glycosyltransferase family 2 protein [Cerasicoccus maritimus]|uniref:glycosyltransferase family 2 protein n=1 Tax=Cerasicoccus maritimus TaxID=490089 RepID=UPI002852B046|nr:glycosyltransferase family 2 protein [Cerasicoccus maritimus]
MSETFPSLSVSIIAHNEAAIIRRCLDSVKDLADEIILVVNDCDDGTDTIAQEEYGARVIYETWHGHRDQKNIALQHVTKDWVLCVDCDEELSGALQDEIRAFLKTLAKDFSGASFPRKNWFLGRWITHGDWYPDRSLRLFKNGSGKWAGSREHDSMRVEGSVYKLKHDLHHYSTPTLTSQIGKISYFSDIFLQREIDKGKKFSVLGIIFRPFWRFVRGYFLRLGFLDGFPGFYIAIVNSFSSFVRHSRIYEYETTPEVKAKFDQLRAESLHRGEQE